MTSRLIRSGPSDLPSSPSKSQSGVLQVTDRSATRIPSSCITGRHPRSTSSPIWGGVLPLYRGAVGVFYSPSRQGEPITWFFFFFLEKTKFNKLLKKARGHIDRNIVNMKMKTIVWKPWMIKSFSFIIVWFGLVWWVLWHINLCRLFNAKSIFM